jgi:hypothetical protein
MDALDETYTSWIDELRRARGRIIVPEQWLSRDGTDGKFYFDEDQTAFVRLPNMGPPGEEGGEGITLVQFDIRAEQHRATAMELIDRIITAAGYSPQSFGLSTEGRAESGTALRIRERKSLMTTTRKQRYFQRPLEDILHLMLQVDKQYFGTRDTDLNMRPVVTFADSIQESLGEMGEALSKIAQAQAASTDTKVRWLHPDWTEEQIQKEVEEINKEQGITIDGPDAVSGSFPRPGAGMDIHPMGEDMTGDQEAVIPLDANGKPTGGIVKNTKGATI